jgi:hypothetical protein
MHTSPAVHLLTCRCPALHEPAAVAAGTLSTMSGNYSYSAPTSPAAACSYAAAWESSTGQQRAASPGPTAAASTTTWAAGTMGPDAFLQRSNSPLMFTTYPEAVRSESPLSIAGASSKGFQQVGRRALNLQLHTCWHTPLVLIHTQQLRWMVAGTLVKCSNCNGVLCLTVPVLPSRAVPARNSSTIT